jgi:hypothetical protein
VLSRSIAFLRVVVQRHLALTQEKPSEETGKGGARRRSHLSGAQASVSGVVEDTTGFCSDAAPLPIVGRRTDAAPPSWIIIAMAGIRVNADPQLERAAMVCASEVERRDRAGAVL